MLGLVLIYFVGKKIYDLAERHQKNAWGNAILGVVIYYGGSIVGAMIVGVLIAIFSSIDLEGVNETLLGLIGVPFGIGAWYGYCVYLRKKWEKEEQEFVDELDEIGRR